MARFLCAIIGAFLLCHGAALAQEPGHHHHGGGAPACPDSSLACATAATPAFAPDGSLWLAWSAGGRVMVARSTDLGRSFSAPVPITPEQERLDTGADARPAIVVDREGRVFVAYALFKDDAYNGVVMFTRSTDGGASFAPPRPLTDDPASQRFAALAVAPNGHLFAAWIDKREAAAAKSRGAEYPGAALAFAWSGDGGATFSTVRIARNNTCECCRLGVAFTDRGQPVVLWRDTFGGLARDHAVTTFADPATPGPVYRVSVDDWEVDVCPHHGPALALTPDGAYHVAWFTQGRVRQGLFYARSTDGGRSFSAPMAIGDARRQPSRPQLLAAAGALWLAWKEFDGETTTVSVTESRDGGVRWSQPKIVARTADASDHPQLVSDGRRAFLSWLTRAEGYRLVALEDVP
jgi:hypothetical protein